MITREREQQYDCINLACANCDTTCLLSSSTLKRVQSKPINTMPNYMVHIAIYFKLTSASRKDVGAIYVLSSWGSRYNQFQWYRSLRIDPKDIESLGCMHMNTPGCLCLKDIIHGPNASWAWNIFSVHFQQGTNQWCDVYVSPSSDKPQCNFSKQTINIDIPIIMHVVITWYIMVESKPDYESSWYLLKRHT